MLERFREMKARGEKIAVLTAYDYPMARLLDESGIDIILVGDSLGMVVLGHPDTTLVSMADMLHHTRAVSRGAKQTLVVADLPFQSYEDAPQAVENARRLIDAGAQAVKLEGGVAQAPKIEAIIAEKIPVMAHIGMLPQSVREEGGYKIKGRTPEQAAALMEDAKAVETAGAFAVVMELVQTDLAKTISAAITIPTIGIGSGAHCDGQVLVTHDLIGFFPWFTPKFITPRIRVGNEIGKAVRAFISETKAHS